jgi:hypothetical protein
MKLVAVDLIDLVAAGKKRSALPQFWPFPSAVDCHLQVQLLFVDRLAVLVLHKKECRSSELAYSCK